MHCKPGPKHSWFLNRWLGSRLREEVRGEAATPLGFPGNDGPGSPFAEGGAGWEWQVEGQVEILGGRLESSDRPAALGF